MDGLIIINNTHVKVKEWKGQRVVTLKEIDELHGRVHGTAGRNFAANKDKFIEDEDYFYLTYQEVNSTNFVELPSPNGLTVITESGYLMIVKSFNDELAWRVQRELVKTYFRAKNFTDNIKKLSPQLQLLIGMELEQKRIRQELTEAKQQTAAVKQEVQGIREVITVVPGENWRKDTNALMTKVCKTKKDFKTPKEQAYRALEERAKCNLKVRLGNLRERALANGMAGSRVDSLNYLDVIEEDVRLKEIYTSIVKEMAVKNGVSV